MTAARPAFTTPLFGATSYITPADYKSAPTGINTSNLIVGGNQAANDAALADVIRRASGWADEICQQALAATVDIEDDTVRVQRDGTAHIACRYFPVLSVLDVQVGASPSTMTQLTDLSVVFFDHAARGFSIDLAGGLGGSAGQLDFAGRWGYRSQLRARWTYINGYPSTTLAQAASAGATQITVADATGVFGGPAATLATATVPPATTLTIYDGANTERISVASVAGNVLTLNAALQFPHSTTGVTVSALPDSARQAVVLLTTALIKTRGDRALVMESVSGKPRKEARTEAGGAEDEAIARDLLASFTRTF